MEEVCLLSEKTEDAVCSLGEELDVSTRKKQSVSGRCHWCPADWRQEEIMCSRQPNVTLSTSVTTGIA
jgi:hypothetical protein